MPPANTSANTTYTGNRVRSSIVPHTIARLTVQNTTSNRNFAETATAENDSDAKSEPCRKKPSRPSTSLPLPNARPKPTAQNAIVPIERLTRIFATTAPTFLPREKPTSSIAKPACIRNTMHAATITQTVSIAIWLSAFVIPPLPYSGNKKGRQSGGLIAGGRTSPSDRDPSY